MKCLNELASVIDSIYLMMLLCMLLYQNSGIGGKAATVTRTKFRTKALCFGTTSPPPNSDMMIGSVTMEYCDTANEKAFLHAPLMHPRLLKYGRHNTRRPKLFLMGIPYACSVVSCAMNVIERASDLSTFHGKQSVLLFWMKFTVSLSPAVAKLHIENRKGEIPVWATPALPSETCLCRVMQFPFTETN